METNERWLTDGNCKECRRAKYCSKPCTAKKRMFRAMATQLVRTLIMDKIGEYDEEVKVDE